VIKSTLQPVEE